MKVWVQVLETVIGNMQWSIPLASFVPSRMKYPPNDHTVLNPYRDEVLPDTPLKGAQDVLWDGSALVVGRTRCYSVLEVT